MVIKLCLDVLLLFWRAILGAIEFASLPVEVGTMLVTVFSKLSEGMAFINAYIDTQYIGLLFGVVLSVIAVQNAYRLFMWVAKKIPFLGIE